MGDAKGCQPFFYVLAELVGHGGVLYPQMNGADWLDHQKNSLRFYFYSKDHQPIHIHVENADGEAKFEIKPDVKLVYNKGLKNKDLRLAESIIEENRENFIEQWENVFSKM